MLSRYNVPGPHLPVWGWGGPMRTSGIHQMMDRLFEDFEATFGSEARDAKTVAPSPRAQLRDLGDTVSLLVDLPGATLEHVDLSIEGTTVTLRVAAPASSIPEGFSPLHRERKQRAIEWSFELPYPIDAGTTSAVLEQGWLRVTLPKAAEAKPRRIAVAPR
jgi:HSP20 family protein